VARSKEREAVDRFVILTGGPGSGKTAIIEALRQAGYFGSVEAGRGVIQHQVSIGGQGLPWEDKSLFAELMLTWEMRSYRQAEAHAGPVFFDRGVPDVLGYLLLSGLPVPAHVSKATELYRYHRRVFIAPPWEEIFHPDRERKQNFDEAMRTYQVMLDTYGSCGYELVELPRAPVAERVRFVLEEVSPLLPSDRPRS
jgi:predicted ATPase